jgi:hypothetical protein
MLMPNPRPNPFRRPVRMPIPVVKIAPVKRRRSQTSVATRQRKSRRMRRQGFKAFRVWLPIEELTEGVRAREGLAKNSVPTPRQIKRAIDEGFSVWLAPWLLLARNK